MTTSRPNSGTPRPRNRKLRGCQAEEGANEDPIGVRDLPQPRCPTGGGTPSRSVVQIPNRGGREPHLEVSSGEKLRPCQRAPLGGARETCSSRHWPLV